MELADGGDSIGSRDRRCSAGVLDIPDPDAASHQFGMLAYGPIREKGLLGEKVTEDDVAAGVQRAVRVFLTGYARTRREALNDA